MSKKINQNGFSLVEIIVVIAITVLILGIGFLSYRNVQNRQKVVSASQLLAQDIRRAQGMALEARTYNGIVPSGYGIYVSADSSSYILFADCVGGTMEFYDAGGTPCGVPPPDAPEKIEEVFLERGVAVASLCHGGTCDGTIRSFHILFKPPHPETILTSYDGIATSTFPDEASVIIGSPGGLFTQRITVFKSGLVDPKDVRTSFAPPPPQQFTLSVTTTTGTGSGTATSSPAGINCPGDCEEVYDSGTNVTLTAAPDANSSFGGWFDDCSDVTVTTTVTMNNNKNCTAMFTLLTTGNVDGWAWSNDQSPGRAGIGWVDFGYIENNDPPGVATSSGVRVESSVLKGWAQVESLKPRGEGWISMNCENTASCATFPYAVARSALGVLSGWAWSSDFGWISFNCVDTATCGTGPGQVDYRVQINRTPGPDEGVWNGWAWSENFGWLSFNSTDPGAGGAAYKVCIPPATCL